MMCCRSGDGTSFLVAMSKRHKIYLPSDSLVMRRSIAIIALILFGLALLFGALGLISYETLRSWGHFIRSADDVTVDRFLRFRHIGFFGFISCLVASISLWRCREAVSLFLADLFRPRSISICGSDLGVWCLAILIVAAGFGLRFAFLFQPMAYDEAYTYTNFARLSLPEAIGNYNSTNNHVLNTLLIYITTRIWGPAEWAIRLPVFCCGVLLIPAVFLWGRAWLGVSVGLMAAAFVAVSPELITYSVDARGYMYVALAAIVLDASLAKLRQKNDARMWLSAAGAIVFGLCAMPIMLYSTVASVSWYLFLPEKGETLPRKSELLKRLRQCSIMLLISAVMVGLFYSPAYIFRGLQFLRDPIMRPAVNDQWLQQLFASWVGGFDWWVDGAFPTALWLVALVAGGVATKVAPRFWIRWGPPFLVVLIINLLQRFAPPPRIFLHLASWVYLLAALGILWLIQVGVPFIIALRVRRSGAPEKPTKISIENLNSGIFPIHIGAAVFALITLTAGVAEAMRRDVLFFPEERTSFVSVPDVIKRLHREIVENPSSKNLLLAPLPCDLPSIFYMDRYGFRVDVNRVPDDEEQVWLIARDDETPQQVLNSGLIKLGSMADQFDRWEQVEQFQTLTLYRSRFHK